MDQAIDSAASAPNDRQIVITRILDAPRQLVWKAWTEPEHLVRWWGPEGFESYDCTIDLRVGGAFSLKMRGPDGTVYPCDGTFLEIVRPERIVYEGDRDMAHPCGAGLPPRSRVTVTFAEADGRTTLTIDTQFETTDGQTAARDAGYATSWPGCLDRLARELVAM